MDQESRQGLSECHCFEVSDNVVNHLDCDCGLTWWFNRGEFISKLIPAVVRIQFLAGCWQLLATKNLFLGQLTCDSRLPLEFKERAREGVRDRSHSLFVTSSQKWHPYYFCHILFSGCASLVISPALSHSPNSKAGDDTRMQMPRG